VIESLGYSLSDFRSKSLDEFSQPGAPQMDFIFTLCDDAADEVPPVWASEPVTAFWGIPDPATATGSEAEIELAFLEAARQLRNRIELLIALPIEKLDQQALRSHLQAIGSAGAETKVPGG
jgi:arsenate reductase